MWRGWGVGSVWLLLEAVVAQDEAALIVRCTERLASVSSAVNSACCPTAAACGGGVPADCSAACAALWEPFALKCSKFLDGEFPQFSSFTSKCEATSFPAGNERCSDAVWAAQIAQVATDCCGANGELCTGPVPSECSAACIPTYEAFYARCHEEFPNRAADQMTQFSSFLSACQAADDAPLAPPPPPEGDAGGQGTIATGVDGCAASHCARPPCCASAFAEREAHAGLRYALGVTR